MTISERPEPGTIVELTAADEAIGGVRVISTDGTLITCSMSPATVPDQGTTVVLRWPAGPRGRYVLNAGVVSVSENRIAVEPTGKTAVEQHRQYVRGGGGEPVLLRKPGHEDAYGWIRDIGEQGIRAHFAGLDLQDGDELTILVELGPDIVELKAIAAKVAKLRQQVPPGPMSVELVAIFLPGEAQARIIRRYVLHQQMLSRTRA